jgi:hypothetical protein
MCKTFGVLPSDYARRLYGPLLPKHITPMDWYAFDVATTWTYYELLAQENDDDGPTGSPSDRERLKAPRASRRNPVAEQGEGLHIKGGEVPPWARR